MSVVRFSLLGVLIITGCGTESSNNKRTLYAPTDPIVNPVPANATGQASNSPQTNSQGGHQSRSSQAGKNESGLWESVANAESSSKPVRVDDPAGLLSPKSSEDSSRPANVQEWSAEQVLAAIDEEDVKVIDAIELFAEKSRGNAKAVDQLQQWILRLGDGKSKVAKLIFGGGYQFGPRKTDSETTPDLPEDSPTYQIGEALIRALVENGTSQAFAVIQRVSTGKTKTGLGTNQTRSLTTSLLLKNLSNPNNSTRDVLRSALEARNLAPTDETIVAAAQRAEELYLALLLSTMKGVMGVPEEIEEEPFGNVPSGFKGYGNSWNDWSDRGQRAADIVDVETIELSQAEALSLIPEVWDQETIGLMTSVFEKFPSSPQALLLLGQIPNLQTRRAIQTHFQENVTFAPDEFVAANVFEEHLLDAAIHVIIKTMPRAVAPGTPKSEFAPKRRRDRTRERTLDSDQQMRLEEKIGWYKASEQTLFGLLDRMAMIAVHGDSSPYNPDEIPFSLHRASAVTASHRFALPMPDNSGESLPVAHTVVNYVRIDLPRLDDRIVEEYRSSIRDEEVHFVLEGRAGWLDVATEKRRDTGHLLSVDIVVSKNGARSLVRPGQGANLNTQGAIEILVVEISDPTQSEPTTY